MRISYRQLNLYLFGFLAWLRKQGVSPGSAITFLSPKTIASSPIPQISILCVVAGLSAMLGGFVMVESGQARRTVVLWDASEPPSESTLSQSSSPQLLPIPQDWFAALEDDLRGMTLLGLIRETVTSHPLPCLMAKSSGTTGIPKVIPIMPDMMLLRAQSLERNEPLIANSRLSMKAVTISSQTFCTSCPLFWPVDRLLSRQGKQLSMFLRLDTLGNYMRMDSIRNRLAFAFMIG